MKENLHQIQELNQQQRLTPMQVQFVRMLEMTGPEIEAEVQRSLDEMPALEAVDREPRESAESSESFSETAEEVQMADYAGDDDIPAYLLNAHNYSPDAERFEPIALNDEASLGESLRHQLPELNLDSREMMIADYVIGNLDGNGYLKRDTEMIADDIAIQTGEYVSKDEVDCALEAVRSLDPPGVGATDLRDCLLLQLKRRQPSEENEIATAIIRDHFDLFSRKDFEVLDKRMKVDGERFRKAINTITHLNPKPGNQQGDTALESNQRMIVPDFLVEPEGDKLNVTLLNDIPELAISSSFAENAPLPPMNPRQKNDTLTFIRTRREEAANFITTLKMRQTTLFNVMAAIASIQRDFFMTGDETLIKPMVLKDIAERTGYDISVISRATASKYVMTLTKPYPLKFFFNERHNPTEDITFHQIADAMRAIIEGENKRSPLSDDAIAESLAARGFNVARRTVTKYRERLGLPVARLRRELQTNPSSPRLRIDKHKQQ